MKTNYVTKIENKYVFNLSLIVWHTFIALSSIAVVVSFGIFLWSVVPAWQKKVEKSPYPAKSEYPAPIAVSISELQLGGAKEEAPTLTPEQVKAISPTKQQPAEDLTGKKEYEVSLNTLKTLIPPSKYSWAGSGYWTYPLGERYWTYYKQEQYRQWISTESGIEDKLQFSFIKAEARNYTEKQQMLDGYINVVKLLPENKRLIALQSLIDNTSNSVSINLTILESIAKVVLKMPNEENVNYMDLLASFGKSNPNDGPTFIDYTSTIIEKFARSQRVDIIDRLISSYDNFFSRNLAKQQDVTNLFLPLVSQIKGELQPKAIIQYYRVFLEKNHERDLRINQIDNEYKQLIAEIDDKFQLDQINATQQYYDKKVKKAELRTKSLAGIGGGILLIVLIATILVFLSIQRSVRKIEEKISPQDNI